MRRESFHALFVALLAGVIAFTNLGNFSGSTGDETLHITVTLEMMQSGNWLIPTLDGQPYLNKPPLKMWMSMLPIALLGPTNFAFRFLDATAGVLTALLLWWLTFKLTRSSIFGVISATALLSCDAYIFNHGIRNAVQDSWLILFSSTAIASGALLLAELEQGPVEKGRRLKLALLAGISIGCALLTKSAGGLIAIPILGCLALTGALWKNFRETFSSALIIGVTAALVAGLYYIPAYLQDPPLFSLVFEREVLNRARHGYHNTQNYLFYWGRLLQLRYLNPLLLAVALPVLCVTFRASFASRLALLWALVPVVLYSIIPSRMEWYIAPAFPGMGLSLGIALYHLAAYYKAFRSELPLSFAQTTKRILVLLTLFLTVGLLAYDTALVVRRVNLPKTRGAFDLLTEELRRAKVADELGIRIIIEPEFRARHNELPYLTALRPYATDPKSVVDKSAEGRARTILFTSWEKFSKQQDPQVTASLKLPRDIERRRTMIVVQYGEPLVSSQLKR